MTLMALGVGMLVPVGDAELVDFHVIKCTRDVDKLEPVLDAERADQLKNAWSTSPCCRRGEESRSKGNVQPRGLGAPGRVDAREHSLRLVVETCRERPRSSRPPLRPDGGSLPRRTDKESAVPRWRTV